MFISYLFLHNWLMSSHGLQKEKFATIFYEMLDNLLSHNNMDCLPVVCFITLTFHHVNA